MEVMVLMQETVRWMSITPMKIMELMCQLNGNLLMAIIRWMMQTVAVCLSFHLKS